MSECEKWLAEYLKQNGTVLRDAVRDEARKRGFKKTEIKAARKNIGVKCCNDWAANGETQNWFWYLED